MLRKFFTKTRKEERFLILSRNVYKDNIKLILKNWDEGGGGGECRRDSSCEHGN
jgi:hypothetical protein